MAESESPPEEVYESSESLNPETLEFSLPSHDLELAEKVREQYFDLLNKFGWQPVGAMRLSEGAREAILNAMEHGHDWQESKLVKVILKVDQEKIEIVVRDQGPGFVRQELPDPYTPENLMKPRGRGIYAYMEANYDNVSYQETADGFEVRLTKSRPKTSGSN